MKISLTDGADIACDEYVRHTIEGGLEHLPVWGSMVERIFGHRSMYLAARDGASVVGVLPMTLVRSRVFGDKLVSQAFANYGGPLSHDLDVQCGLLDEAVRLAKEVKCRHVEFRCMHPLPYPLDTRADKVTCLLTLPADPATLWNSLDCKVRNQVRKAEKAGLVTTEGGAEHLDAFYDVWTRRMSQLGTPCYARKLFSAIMDTFPQCCRVFLVHCGEVTVGGAFVYCFKGRAQIRWASTHVTYNSLCPNQLLYWAVMKHYCEAGADCFDFGRTTVDSGQHRFKKQWGAETIPLHYQYWVHPEGKVSLVRPDSPKYRMAVQVWKRLPLWLSRIIGPHVSAGLP